MTYPVSDAPCSPVTGVTQAPVRNLNLHKRSSMQIACWKVRNLLDTGSQCISMHVRSTIMGLILLGYPKFAFPTPASGVFKFFNGVHLAGCITVGHRAVRKFTVLLLQ